MLAGLLGLWLGTELVVNKAVKIAEYYNLSQLFIGIAILAVGTDLPEMVIAINASVQNALHDVDTSGIIIGNAIGSSFTQISLVLGITGTMGYLTLTRRHLYEDGAMLIGTIILVFLLGYDTTISRLDGIALLTVYAIYYFSQFYKERLGKKMKRKPSRSIKRDVVLLTVGVLVVVVTSELVVDNAISLAEKLHIRQSFVGILLIGLGTSLPELALSINAIRKKAHGLSVGNLIGSNIFDLLVPVGLGALIAELHLEKRLLWFDLTVLLGLSLLVLFFFFKKKGLQPIEAIVLIGVFLVYAALKLMGA